MITAYVIRYYKVIQVNFIKRFYNGETNSAANVFENPLPF